MSEQLFHRGRIELVNTLEFLGMDAAGEEQTIDSETERAGEIGPHRIPDRQHTVERGRPAAAFGGERHGALIDRTMRIAVADSLASDIEIVLGARLSA